LVLSQVQTVLRRRIFEHAVKILIGAIRKTSENMAPNEFGFVVIDQTERFNKYNGACVQSDALIYYFILSRFPSPSRIIIPRFSTFTIFLLKQILQSDSLQSSST
jgi:hypothetical protein